jgi:type IX secretion system PorP/SprF family membrane protein|tara:strand:- start:4875 stop:5888 length:1014 start_codon:yes stop_codon:yes gene_type:complete
MVKKLLFILLISSASLKAQDVHFTQWMFSPLNLNPGETGRFDGDYRITGNFRSQWAAVMEKQYKTFGVSYDQIFKVYNQELSAGITFVNDRSSVGDLMQNKVQVSAGYIKNIKGTRVSGGVQLGLLHKGIDPNAYSYPVQWDTDQGEFSNAIGIGNGEMFSQTNDYMFDFNFGVGLGRQFGKKLYPEIGLAWFHVNTPEESFLGDQNDLTLRHVYNLKVNYKLSDKFVITPNALFMYQIKGQDLVLGAIGKMKIEDNKTKIDQVFAGFNYRDGFNRNYDAMNLIIGARRDSWQVGVSYDINVSSLSSVTHYRGAFELSVIYIAKSSEPSIFIVPCDL